MKLKIVKLLLLSLIPIKFATAQSKKLNQEYCDCLVKNSDIDSVKIQQCLTQVLYKPLSKIKSEQAIKDFLLKFDINLQKDCPEYVRIMQKTYPVKGDWVKLEMNPPSKLSSEKCQGLTKHQMLYYLESSGDTTQVKIVDGIWLELLKQNKYFSKLQLSLKNNCEFVLTFIESNDPIKSNMSTKGEKYNYRIVDQIANYYIVTVSKSKIIYQFNLYFK